MAVCAPFAPSIVEAMLMQSVTLLSQLRSVGTSVLNLSSLLTLQFCSGRRGLSTAFSLKALLSFPSQTATTSPPAIPKHGGFNTCGCSRGSRVPDTLWPSHHNLAGSAQLSRALGVLLRSSYPAKSKALPDQRGLKILVAVAPHTDCPWHTKEATQMGHCQFNDFAEC